MAEFGRLEKGISERNFRVENNMYAGDVTIRHEHDVQVLQLVEMRVTIVGFVPSLFAGKLLSAAGGHQEKRSR